MAKWEPSPHRDEAIAFLKEGLNSGRSIQELKTECAAKYEITVRTTERYIAQIMNPAKPKVKVAAGAKKIIFNQTLTENTPLVDLNVKGAALSEVEIKPSITPADSDEWGDALRIYRYLKRSHNIKDDFGSVVCDGVTLLSDILDGKYILAIPSKLMEAENDGERIGSGEAEVGAQQAG